MWEFKVVYYKIKNFIDLIYKYMYDQTEQVIYKHHGASWQVLEEVAELANALEGRT